MPLDLSAYLLEIGDTRDLVEKVNNAINAVQDGVNTNESDVGDRLDDQDAIIDGLAGAMTSGVTFKGTHSAAGAAYPVGPVNGDYWIISAAGTISSVYYTVGDAIVYYSSAWIRIPSQPDMSAINPLAKAIRVAITAATSASNGIQQLSNVQNNFGTGRFAIQYKDAQPDWTPASSVILCSKHDGTLGYILTLRTTGVLRLTLNGTTFDSTAATGLPDGDVGAIDVDIIPATATAAGSVTFTLNGVQLGTSLAISARVEKITNGTFATDVSGWTLAPNSTGTVTWVSGKMRVERTGGSTTRAYQAISMAAGETLYVQSTVTWVSGASATASMTIRDTADSLSSSQLAASNTTAAGAGGTCVLNYYSATAQTVYLHCSNLSAVGAHDFDNVTSLDSATVENTANLYVCGTSTTRSATEWYGHRLFNRAKSVAENLMMQKKGVAPADVGGSQTAKSTSDFSAGTNSFTGVSGVTVTGNQDAVYGVDDTMLIESNGSASARARRSNFGGNLFPFTSITIQAVRPAANVTCAGIQLVITEDGSDAVYASFDLQISAADTWQTFVIPAFSLPSPVPTGRRIAIYPVTAGNVTTVTSGDKVWVKALTTYQAGCTSELAAENAQSNTGQVLDTSGNKQHAMLPAAGASILGKPNNGGLREVRGTNTWAGTHELQYIGGVNQAIWPSNAKIESIVCVITGTVIEDFQIGDGSDADRYVATTTAITTGTKIMTLTATPFTDGTNLKLTIDPDANFTGSIATTVRYTLLET